MMFEVGICTDSLRFNRTTGEERYCGELEPLGVMTIGKNI